MKTAIPRQQALELLMKYNKEPFHLLHGLTVEGTMRWYAKEMGFKDEVEFWGIAGLLHDVDFERFPEEHCKKAPELLSEIGAEEELIHAICSHGYGICSQVKPEHKMEKILFAAGCSREVIASGAKNLDWTLEELFEKTILAMRSCEDQVDQEVKALEGK